LNQEKSSATFTLRLPRDLHDRLQQCASAGRMSINTWILRAIDAALTKADEGAEQ
jgi:predicted HicB family RNase H-like nuclease